MPAEAWQKARRHCPLACALPSAGYAATELHIGAPNRVFHQADTICYEKDSRGQQFDCAEIEFLAP